MLKLTLCVLLAIIALSAADKQCWATGDPHYRTFDGFYFDMYGITGDAILSRAKDDSFSVTTRIKYGQHWANRGLQTAVVMVMDGNVFEHYGNYWTMNGVRNSMSGLRRPEKVKIQMQSNRFVFHSLVTGVVIDMRNNFVGGMPVWPDWYFDIYVNIPTSFYGQMEGLCGSGNANANIDAQNYYFLTARAKPSDPYVRVIMQPHDARNHFGLTYVPKKSAIAPPLDWKSKAEKDKAYAFCTSLKLNEDHLFHDCLADVQQSGGDFSMAANYKLTKEDLAELSKDKDEYLKKLAAIELAMKKSNACPSNLDVEAAQCKKMDTLVDSEEKKISLIAKTK